MSDLVATPEQVADALQCSIDVVRDLRSAGRLPHVMLTRSKWVVPWQALREWLEDEAHASVVAAELEADGVDLGLSKHKGAA